MRSFATILASAAAILLSAGTAMADGMSIKDGPAPVAEARTCDGGPFAGFYIGAAVGYGGQDTDFNDKIGGGGVSGDDDGFAASLYSGYNIQCGRLVVGYESDWNFLDTEGSWTDGCCQNLTSELRWFGTSRLRFGLVHSGNMMFFVTGGLAYADIENTFALDLPYSSSSTDWTWGWTAGGGIDFLRDDRWGLRAEALYIDLSENANGYVYDCGGSCVGRIGYDNEFWVGRIGLTYKFGPREEAAVPMK
jgi:outer membrane immunogenic protein